MKLPPEIQEYAFGEVATMLRCSTRTVRRLVASGILPAKHYSRKTVRIPIEAVWAYRDSHAEVRRTQPEA